MGGRREILRSENNGYLPNLSVENTDGTDWAALWDLIRSQGWAWSYASQPDLSPESGGGPGQALPEPTALHDSCETVFAWPAPDFRLNFFPDFGPSEIRFHVDIRELQGQKNLNMLCEVIKLIGRTLDKTVAMSPEGFEASPYLGFDVAEDAVIRLPADPP